VITNSSSEIYVFPYPDGNAVEITKDFAEGLLKSIGANGRLDEHFDFIRIGDELKIIPKSDKTKHWVYKLFDNENIDNNI
jgi:hypothetical protein